MKVQLLNVEKRKGLRIEKYKLLVSINENFGFCSDCKKSEQKLYLNLVKRETEPTPSDIPSEYCYDCATNQINELSKPEYLLNKFTGQEKRNFISSIIIELARAKQGSITPSKFEIEENLKLLNKNLDKSTQTKTEAEEKAEKMGVSSFCEDNYIMEIDKHRDDLMAKAEEANQKWEKTHGELPFTVASRTAKYSKYNSEEKQEKKNAEIYRVTMTRNKLKKENETDNNRYCFSCEKNRFLDSSMGGKWYWETDSSGKKIIYCGNCVEEAQEKLNNLEEFRVDEKPKPEEKKGNASCSTVLCACPCELKLIELEEKVKNLEKYLTFENGVTETPKKNCCDCDTCKDCKCNSNSCSGCTPRLDLS